MNKKILFVGGVVVAYSILGIPVWSKLRQSEAGVCAFTGTILSNEQLRKEVIANLARNKQDIVRHQDVEYVPGVMRFRISDSISDEDIARAVYALRGGRDSFEEGFAFRTEGEVERSLREPLILLTYESGRNLTSYAVRTSSRDVQKIRAKSITLSGFSPSLWQRLHGYGNHYFGVKSRTFTYECCAPQYSENSPFKNMVPVVYREPGENGWVISAGDKTKVAVVSNCGEVLTYRDTGGFSRIKWTKGE